ncbi:MAG: CrcB family protein, partial [Acidimicrobiia bacterium]
GLQGGQLTLVAAGLAGSLGAILRYLLSGWAQERFQRDFPVGTMLVNLTGSFVLGIVVGADPAETLATIALIGFLGGFTTFSSWMVETVLLGARSRGAWLNLSLTLLGGVGIAVLGFILGYQEV